MIRIFVCYSKTNKYFSNSWLRIITNLDDILETIAPTFYSQIFPIGSFYFPTGKYNKTRFVVSTVLSERADGLFTLSKFHLELFLMEEFFAIGNFNCSCCC